MGPWLVEALSWFAYGMSQNGLTWVVDGSDLEFSTSCGRCGVAFEHKASTISIWDVDVEVWSILGVQPNGLKIGQI